MERIAGRHRLRDPAADLWLALDVGDRPRIEVVVFGKNLFDERYCQTIQPGAFTNQCIVNEPATYGIKFGVKL